MVHPKIKIQSLFTHSSLFLKQKDFFFFKCPAFKRTSFTAIIWTQSIFMSCKVKKETVFLHYYKFVGEKKNIFDSQRD